MPCAASRSLLHRGEVLGVVGESGSGKSTLAAAMLNLVAPDAGDIRLDGVPVERISRQAFARRVQPVFQDPYASPQPVAPGREEPLSRSRTGMLHGIGNALRNAATRCAR